MSAVRGVAASVAEEPFRAGSHTSVLAAQELNLLAHEVLILFDNRILEVEDLRVLFTQNLIQRIIEI